MVIVPPVVMIQIQLTCRTIQLSGLEQSLSKAALSRHALRLHLQTRLNQTLLPYSPGPSLLIHPCTLQRMVVKYSEQLVYRPLEEMQHWFGYSGGLFLQPGYPPLFYSRSENRSVSANKSAVAAIGEGVAGFIAQRLYRCRKLARPTHDYPDLVLEGQGKTYLVEAKATTDTVAQVQRTLDEELLRMAAYASCCRELDVRPVIGVLVGTALVSEQRYCSYVNEVVL
jgi:hypothetical protein